MVGVSILVRKRLDLLFFGTLTYVLKENDTKNIMGIPKIYNVNRNETNKWLQQASHITKQKLRPTRYASGIKTTS